MAREAGKATPMHRAYAAYLTATSGQKVSVNTVQLVISSLPEFRESEEYAELKATQDADRQERQAAKIEERRAALRAKLAELSDDDDDVKEAPARRTTVKEAPARPAPAKRAPRKAAAKVESPTPQRGGLRSVEANDDADDDFGGPDDADDF